MYSWPAQSIGELGTGLYQHFSRGGILKTVTYIYYKFDDFA